MKTIFPVIMLSLFFALPCAFGQDDDSTAVSALTIGMTSIVVNNPHDALRFYIDTLGFVEYMYMPEANIAIVVSANDRDGTTLMLEPNDNPIAKNFQKAIYDAGFPWIVFFTEDINAEYDRLTNLGVVFKQPPTYTGFGTQAIFYDNQGNWIQLHQLEE